MSNEIIFNLNDNYELVPIENEIEQKVEPKVKPKPEPKVEQNIEKLIVAACNDAMVKVEKEIKINQI